MTHDCDIRSYRDGDEQQILRLRQRVFGDLDPVRLSSGTWRWQFRYNPAGEGFCALAEDHGRIVGQYAVIPTRFWMNGKRSRFAMSCDTMIHPAYRRKGLFTKLAREVYRHIESVHGIQTVWGFPNKASLPGFTMHLDWRLLKLFPLRVMPLRPLGICYGLLYLGKKPFPARGASRRHKHAKGEGKSVGFARRHGLVIEPLRRFSEEFDVLWKTHGSLVPIIQVRNADYLNWRYFGVSDFGYRVFAIRQNRQLAGYIVLRIMTQMGCFFGVLTDVFPFPVQDIPTTSEVFRFARDYCRTQGAEFLTCLISRADPSFLRNAGFFKIPKVLNPRPWYFGARYSPGDAPVLSREKDWHLTYGDTDIV
ncbi:MAG: GNAT family N-acetyltransferase [Deltaproteobacteria bacterium]|nr:GNAT family N-acetyltransferase [Deltaproteobacteria bacterium]